MSRCYTSTWLLVSEYPLVCYAGIGLQLACLSGLNEAEIITTSIFVLITFSNSRNEALPGGHILLKLKRSCGRKAAPWKCRPLCIEPWVIMALTCTGDSAIYSAHNLLHVVCILQWLPATLSWRKLPNGTPLWRSWHPVSLYWSCFSLVFLFRLLATFSWPMSTATDDQQWPYVGRRDGEVSAWHDGV